MTLASGRVGAGQTRRRIPGSCRRAGARSPRWGGHRPRYAQPDPWDRRERRPSRSASPDPARSAAGAPSAARPAPAERMRYPRSPQARDLRARRGRPSHGAARRAWCHRTRPAAQPVLIACRHHTRSLAAWFERSPLAGAVKCGCASRRTGSDGWKTSAGIMERLTTEDCRAIAERRLLELDGLDAQEVLARYDVHRGAHDEHGIEDGKRYRCRLWTLRQKTNVLICVLVAPMPEADRPGLLGLIDAGLYGTHVSRSVAKKLLPL